MRLLVFVRSQDSPQNLDAIALALDQGEWQTAKTAQKGHGRLEVREIWTSTQRQYG